MILTKYEFLKRWQENNLQIAFMGMSNIGKTFRAKQFQKEKGFRAACIDEAIADILGFEDEAHLAYWLGQPYTEDFTEKQEHYLKLEGDMTRRSVKEAEGNFVLDTTGSIIYLPTKTQEHVKKNFLIINLESTPAMVEMMAKDFFENPKPVIWGEKFEQKKGEEEQDALRRCYPELLAHRLEKYKVLADITIDGRHSRDNNISIDDFVVMIEDLLPIA